MDTPKHAQKGALKQIRHLCVAALFLFAASPVWADYAAEWGPQVGTALPELRAPDQDGKAVELADLQGKNGVLIIFNRSADW